MTADELAPSTAAMRNTCCTSPHISPPWPRVGAAHNPATLLCCRVGPLWPMTHPQEAGMGAGAWRRPCLPASVWRAAARHHGGRTRKNHLSICSSANWIPEGMPADPAACCARLCWKAADREKRILFVLQYEMCACLLCMLALWHTVALLCWAHALSHVLLLSDAWGRGTATACCPRITHLACTTPRRSGNMSKLLDGSPAAALQPDGWARSSALERRQSAMCCQATVHDTCGQHQACTWLLAWQHKYLRQLTGYCWPRRGV